MLSFLAIFCAFLVSLEICWRVSSNSCLIAFRRSFLDACESSPNFFLVGRNITSERQVSQTSACASTTPSGAVFLTSRSRRSRAVAISWREKSSIWVILRCVVELSGLYLASSWRIRLSISFSIMADSLSCASAANFILPIARGRGSPRCRALDRFFRSNSSADFFLAAWSAALSSASSTMSSTTSFSGGRSGKTIEYLFLALGSLPNPILSFFFMSRCRFRSAIAVLGVIPPATELIPKLSLAGVPVTPEIPDATEAGVADGVIPERDGVPCMGVARGLGVDKRVWFGVIPPNEVATSAFSPPSSGVDVFVSLRMFCASSSTVSFVMGVRMGVREVVAGVFV
mmetsp:Transcript_15685/g.24834  ORF Transcript_15685/g.24834 Transcript_15685/m.24834 type:complete len:343 (-) Transcript_15685:1068-2096(-)